MGFARYSDAGGVHERRAGAADTRNRRDVAPAAVRRPEGEIVGERGADRSDAGKFGQVGRVEIHQDHLR
jgi:hypothetical protein